MHIFTGDFYAVTPYSVFRIRIPVKLDMSPIIMKMGTKVLSADIGRELRVPVGGTFRKGFFLGITACGIYKYNTAEGETQTIGRSPVPVEDIPGSVRSHNMTKSNGLVALFLHWRDVEVCAENRLEVSLDPRWHFQTREVITAIGLEHPLVSISRKDKYAIPPHLYDISVGLPTLA
jgi:hypothetical protein